MLIRACAVDAARGCINEPRDTHPLAQPRQGYGALVIDVVRDLGIMLAQGVVRQFGQMNDRLISHQVLLDELPDILVQTRGRATDAGVVEPPITVKTRIQPYDIVPAFP